MPEGAHDIVEGVALPAESCIDYMGGINFRKGCYLGQELTVRTHHLGVVRKRILPVQVYALDSRPPPKTLEYDPQARPLLPDVVLDVNALGAAGRKAGRWLGGVGNVGLALCRLETMVGAEEREFGVGERGVGVKAFVPVWHVERARERAKEKERGVGVHELDS